MKEITIKEIIMKGLATGVVTGFVIGLLYMTNFM